MRCAQTGRLSRHIGSYLIFILPTAAFAQPARSVADGVYTQEQAARGKAVYAQQCALCHGANLTGGGESPAVAGDAFVAKWRPRSVDDLFENIRTTMPADRPGSLSREKTADVVAHILATNKFPAGSAELGSQSEALKAIVFDKAAASAAPARGNANANANRNAAPMWAKEDGKPIETRPTEKADNQPTFPQQTRAPYKASAEYKITTLADNMPAPWSLAFLPSGNIILTHRLPGSIRVLDKKGVLSEPIAGVAPLASAKATALGLLDVVLDPKYATNHRIFFTFFELIDGTNSNTNVVSARFDEAKLAFSDVKVIFRAQPAMPSKRLGGKTGGRIAIAKDGSLFVTIGDRSDSPPWDVAQKLDNHLGKLIHITPDGAPSPDNPFLKTPGALPEIWAYGMRSQEGLAFDPKTGKLWQNDHGPRGGDELNIVEKGRNYGWPIVVHGIDYPGKTIGDGIMHKDGMDDPIYYWDPVIAPSGLAFYDHNLFPQWKGSIFVGGLRARMLDRLAMSKEKVVHEEAILTELKERIRDVRVGPDGAVYVLTDSGTSQMSATTPLTAKLLKLTPK